MSRIADIAAALAGYDPKALGVDAVHAFLARLAKPVAIADLERIALRDALGRVLAADIDSPLTVPPHDNSAMDGFAFYGELLETADGASVSLRVVGTAL